ncbi:MAG: Glu/Leu/Phe/Val dehydrogenase [Candidatus Liptonbacteria bacterium]
MDTSKDNFGPEYVIKVKDPKIGLEGFAVIHNTAIGVGKGGVRLMPNVSEEEVYRLASTMTWKNAMAGIPFGGAKSGLRWPIMGKNGKPDTSLATKKRLVQAFARAIKPLLYTKYIAGPDVNSGETEMQWFVEATGNWGDATGKPAKYCTGKGKNKKCGIPHEYGSTGFGVAEAAKIAAEVRKIPIRGATVSIHGFGNVGTFAYKFLTKMGAEVVAIADARGVVHMPKGFEVKKVEKIIKEKKSITAYPGAKILPAEAFWSIPADIMIPASVTDVINEGNYKKIKAHIIVEGGNIPMREQIEEKLVKKGILIVPDFVANAGGVISSYAEHMGYSPEKMFKLVEERIGKAVREVLRKSMGGKRNPRQVAVELAKTRVERAAQKRKQAF